MSTPRADIILEVLQVLEKGSSAIPAAGGFLSSIFGIASVITEKVQRLKQCPQTLRELANDVQNLLLTFECHLREHRHQIVSSKFASALYEIELWVQSLDSVLWFRYLKQAKCSSFYRGFTGKATSSFQMDISKESRRSNRRAQNSI
jgi:hypothetical protein